MAIHSSILAWKIPWTEEPGSPWSHKELDTTEQLHFPTFLLNPVLLNPDFCPYLSTKTAFVKVTIDLILLGPLIKPQVLSYSAKNPAYIEFLSFFPSRNTLLAFSTMFSFDSPPCSSGTSIHFFAGFSSYCQAPNIH